MPNLDFAILPEDFFTEEQFQQLRESKILEDATGALTSANHRYQGEVLGMLTLFGMSQAKVDMEGLSKLSPDEKKSIGNKFLEMFQKYPLTGTGLSQANKESAIYWSKQMVDGAQMMLRGNFPAFDPEHMETISNENYQLISNMQSVCAFLGNGTFLNQLHRNEDILSQVNRSSLENINKGLGYAFGGAIGAITTAYRDISHGAMLLSARLGIRENAADYKKLFTGSMLDHLDDLDKISRNMDARMIANTPLYMVDDEVDSPEEIQKKERMEELFSDLKRDEENPNIVRSVELPKEEEIPEEYSNAIVETEKNRADYINEDFSNRQNVIDASREKYPSAGDFQMQVGDTAKASVMAGLRELTSATNANNKNFNFRHAFTRDSKQYKEMMASVENLRKKMEENPTADRDSLNALKTDFEETLGKVNAYLEHKQRQAGKSELSDYAKQRVQIAEKLKNSLQAGIDSCIPGLSPSEPEKEHAAKQQAFEAHVKEQNAEIKENSKEYLTELGKKATSIVAGTAGKMGDVSDREAAFLSQVGESTRYLLGHNKGTPEEMAHHMAVVGTAELYFKNKNVVTSGASDKLIEAFEKSDWTKTFVSSATPEQVRGLFTKDAVENVVVPRIASAAMKMPEFKKPEDAPAMVNQVDNQKQMEEAKSL